MLLEPSQLHFPNSNSIGSAIFAQLTIDSAYTLQGVAPTPQNCSQPMDGYGPLSNKWYLAPTRTHKANGSSIASAIFAQLTAEFLYTSQRAAPFPLKKCPFP